MGESIEHSLICPNQARTNGVIIDDVPKHLSPGGSSTHSIFFPEENVRLPLQLNGVISCFPTRYPSDQELNDCKWLIMANYLPWEPSSPEFAAHEFLYEENAHHPPVSERDIFSLSIVLHRNVSALNTNPRKLSLSDERIERIFPCSPSVAAKTRLVTTQKGIRSVTGHLTRRFCTKQATLRYDQIGGRHG